MKTKENALTIIGEFDSITITPAEAAAMQTDLRIAIDRAIDEEEFETDGSEHHEIFTEERKNVLWCNICKKQWKDIEHDWGVILSESRNEAYYHGAMCIDCAKDGADEIEDFAARNTDEALGDQL